jgi:hypothetical protein
LITARLDKMFCGDSVLSISAIGSPQCRIKLYLTPPPGGWEVFA